VRSFACGFVMFCCISADAILHQQLLRQRSEQPLSSKRLPVGAGCVSFMGLSTFLIWSHVTLECIAHTLHTHVRSWNTSYNCNTLHRYSLLQKGTHLPQLHNPTFPPLTPQTHSPGYCPDAIAAGFTAELYKGIMSFTSGQINRGALGWIAAAYAPLLNAAAYRYLRCSPPDIDFLRAFAIPSPHTPFLFPPASAGFGDDGFSGALDSTVNQ